MTIVETVVSKVSPTQVQERIERIDIVRGFALFGVLLVNILDFGGVSDAPPDVSWLGSANTGVAWFIDFAVRGKFIAMFSILFGLSLTLQTQRLKEREIRSGWLLIRRMLILLCIGLLHQVLLWDGDILARYGLLGLVFLAFSRTTLRTSIRWMIGFFTFTLLFTFALSLFSDGQHGLSTQAIAQNITLHRESSYFELATSRANEAFINVLGDTIALASSLLTFFLLGRYIEQQGILHRPEEHLPLLRRVLLFGGCIGIVANLLNVTTENYSYAFPTIVQALINGAFIFGIFSLALAYIAGLTLLLQQAFWQRLCVPLAAVGRMALSNYLLQSIIGTTLFYGYGFSLYARLGAAPVIGLALLIYGLQILLSVWWLQHYRFGPVEWFWRSLTYGRLMPFATD